MVNDIELEIAMYVIQITVISVPILLGALAYYGKHIDDPDELSPAFDRDSVSTNEIQHMLNIIFFGLWVLLGAAYFISAVFIQMELGIGHPVVWALAVFGVFMLGLTASGPVVLKTSLKAHTFRIIGTFFALMVGVFSSLILTLVLIMVLIFFSITPLQTETLLMVWGYIMVGLVLVLTVRAILLPWEQFDPDDNSVPRFVYFGFRHPSLWWGRDDGSDPEPDADREGEGEGDDPAAPAAAERERDYLIELDSSDP